MAYADYRVLTPERINLEYGIAGIGSRAAAAIIDTIIQYLTLIVLIFGATATSATVLRTLNITGTSNLLVIALIALALFLVANGYYILFEIFWNGQTPGKRVVGLRVIRENGYPIRPVDAVVRNLIRILDWLPFFYALGVLVMLLNTRSRRLGDFAGGTIVVRETPRARLKQFTANIDTDHGFVLGSTEATLVRDFLVRRHSMNPTARSELASRLANTIAQRYGLAVEADPESFLERLNP